MTSFSVQWCLERNADFFFFKVVRALSNNYSLLTSTRVIVSPVKMTVKFTGKRGCSHGQITQFDRFVTPHYPRKLSEKHCSGFA